MESYHFEWLKNHPDRTEQWLQEKLKEGFDIHHLDGDHANNLPDNLVLIECQDHMSLHGRKICRIRSKRKSKYDSHVKKWQTTKEYAYLIAKQQNKRQARKIARSL